MFTYRQEAHQYPSLPLVDVLLLDYLYERRQCRLDPTLPRREEQRW